MKADGFFIRRGAGISDAHAFLDRHFQKQNTNPTLASVDGLDEAGGLARGYPRCQSQSSKSPYGLRPSSSQLRLKRQQTEFMKKHNQSIASIEAAQIASLDDGSPEHQVRGDYFLNGSEEELRGWDARDADASKLSSLRKPVKNRLSKPGHTDGNQEGRMVSPGRAKAAPQIPAGPMLK